MSDTQRRPFSAYAVPAALVVLGCLDLAVALMPRSADASIAGALERSSVVIVATAGALQLTCAALIVMRRWLGRLLYLYGMPATFVLGGSVSYLQIAAQASAAANADLFAFGAGLALTVGIYAVIAFALTRTGLAAWLAPAAVEAEPEATGRGLPPANPAGALALRLAAFVVLLAGTVFWLGAPIDWLYFAGGAAALIAVLRYVWLQRLWRRGTQGKKDS